MMPQISDVGTRAWGWDRVQNLIAVMDSFPGASSDSLVISNFVADFSVYCDRPQDVVAALFRTPAEWERLQEDFSEIETGRAKDNWDGEGASRISKKTLTQAQRFIGFFPAYLPLPEVAAEPDGHISFDWFIDSNFLLSISIDSKGNLYYAGRFGEVKFHNKNKLDQEIPAKIMGHIERFKGLRLSE